MACAVSDLYQWVERVMFDEFDILKSNEIVLKHQEGTHDYSTALDLLSKIDPHIYAFCEAIGSGGGQHTSCYYFRGILQMFSKL